MKFRLLGASLLLAPSLVFGDQIDDWARAQMHTHHIPGMIVGVYRKGRAIKIGTYGEADVEQHVKIRRNTLFEICSITKQFTAAAVLLLAEEKKISLGDSVARYLPEVPRSWDGITINDLLQHVSDIPQDSFGPITKLPFSKAMAEMSKLPAPKPREAWEYNNGAYCLLGKLIEKVSGQPYFEFLQKRIFDPLQMRDTHPNVPSAVIEHRTRGYSWDAQRNMLVNAPNLTETEGYAAGGLISTIDDLNRWSEALKHGKVLRPESRNLMLTPAKLDGGETAWAEGMSTRGYGLGVFLSGTPEHVIEKHSGGWINASAQLTRFLNDNLTVVVLTNFGNWEIRPWVGEMVGKFYIKDLPVQQWNPTADPQPNIINSVKQILKDLASKQSTDVAITEKLAADIKSAPDDYVALAKPLVLLDFAFVERVPQGRRTIWVYRFKSDIPKFLSVIVDPNGRIEDFSVGELPW